MPLLRPDSARLRRSTLGALMTAGLGLVVAACSAGSSAPIVEDPWIRSNPNGMGAAYLTITMPADDVLVAAEIDPAIAGRVEVHEVVEDDRMMRMREVDGGIPLPAGEAIELRPGGYHLMLLDMPRMLDTGSTITVTLRFATSDPIVVTAEVREGAGVDGMPEHGEHGMQHDQHGGEHGQHGQHGPG